MQTRAQVSPNISPAPSIFSYLPGFSFGQRVDLLLEIDNNFLVLPLEQAGGLFRFDVYFFQQFAQLQELSITLLVDFELREIR